MLELSLFGIITGFAAGFFGIGGGVVLIPMLLFASYDMKQAVSISIMQMVFSSVFGTILNSKRNKEIIKDGLLLGSGGFIGGLASGFIVSSLDGKILQYTFILIVIFAIIRVSITPAIQEKEKLNSTPLRLIIIGIVIGSIAMSIGVGGSIMLTPILAGFLFYNLKHASSLGLFFVVFSSVAGFISLSFTDQMLYSQGTIVGIASLIGVYLGIFTKNKANLKSYKKLILTLYSLILISTIYKLI